MDSPSAIRTLRQLPWPSLWITALVSLLAQLWLCQFFTFGQRVPLSIDVNPCNLWKYAYQFPPRGEFLVLNWFGIANLPPPLNPFGLAAAHWTPWFFFTTYAPLMATCALLAMVAFLRELELARPVALFGGVIYAWQGDLLPFVFPGHYGYITTWPFFAVAAWAALRARRHFAYALIGGASCGVMVGLQPDRGAIASLLIAALYLAPAVLRRAPKAAQIRPLVLCAATALLVSLAAFLALFQSYIVGVKLGAASDRDAAYSLATQYSLGPAETLSYLVPGFFGWHSSNVTGPYWGWIGQPPDWLQTHEGPRNLNLAISTTGTVASILALLGTCLLLPGAPARLGGPGFTQRQLDFGRTFVTLGAVALVLSWGYHTPFYRPLFALPLMDKWRNPLKWLEIFNFAAVVLAAFGAQRAMASVATEEMRRSLRLFLATITGLLFLLLLASYPLSILVAADLAQGGGYSSEAIANVMHTLHVSLGVASLTALFLWLALAAAWNGDRLQHWGIVNPWLRRLWQRALSAEHRAVTLLLALALLATLQLAWVAGQFIETSELSRLTSSNDLLASLQAEGPTVRVAVPQPQNSLLNFFLQNQFAAERISSIDISAASRIPDALAQFVGAFEGKPARLWLLGGVKNVAIGESDLTTMRQNAGVAANMVAADGYTLNSSSNGDAPTHALLRMRDYFNKATFIARGEPLPEDAQLKRLGDPAWNPRDSVLLDPGEGSSAPSSFAEESVPVAVSEYTPHEIRLRVQAPSAGYVLINDQYDPDWEVELNGRPAPLLHADFLLRAVAVGPGVSSIALHYVAHYRVAGLSLPVVATNLFCDAILVLAFSVGGVMLLRENSTLAREESLAAPAPSQETRAKSAD